MLQLSKEATARRFVELYPDPIAVAFHRNGAFRYAAKHDDFPHLALREGENMPPQVPGDTDRGLTDIEQGDWEHWFDRCVSAEISVQTLHQAKGFSMTLLALGDLGDADEDDSGVEDAFSRYNRWNG